MTDQLVLCTADALIGKSSDAIPRIASLTATEDASTAALALLLEGVVIGKGLDFQYFPGVRSPNWLKIKRPGAVPPERFRNSIYEVRVIPVLTAHRSVSASHRRCHSQDDPGGPRARCREMAVTNPRCSPALCPPFEARAQDFPEVGVLAPSLDPRWGWCLVDGPFRKLEWWATHPKQSAAYARTAIWPRRRPI